VRSLWLVCCLAGVSPAAEHWVRFTRGPYEVYSAAGPKEGRETLVKFEEFRHALGQVLGDDDLQAPLRVRIFLFRSTAPQTPEPVSRGRDQYNIVLNAERPIPPAVFTQLTQLFLDANSARMPERLERGLVELLSTLEVTGIRITVGRPPAQPDLDWARIHLLVTDPEYYGKLRVLTYNLRKGVDEDSAFRNAFGKTPEQIEMQAQLHLSAGHFQTASLSPLPMSAQDFPERSADPAAVQLAIADLMLGDSSRTPYRELIAQKAHVAEAWEGLGMLALRDQQKDEARKDFAAAIEAGAKSPSSYLEYARLETDNAKALAALERAAQMNPKLAEPQFMIAQREQEKAKRIQHLKQATKLEPRNAGYWQALAEAQLEAHNYSQAEQSWRSAEQAAVTPADRARFERARMEVEQQRLDWEDAEKRRVADDEAREIEKLKAQARVDLRAIEARANQGQAATNDKVVPWWDGPQPSGATTGVLKAVDCLGKRFRLVVDTDDHKTVKLLVNDLAQIAVIGGGQLTLSCGTQRQRHLKVEYFPKANAKLGTTGEVATIEFQ